jgi:hypothetical protein
MTARLVTLLALLMLVGFLAILVWKLRRLDITLLVAATLGLVLWDIGTTRRR